MVIKNVPAACLRENDCLLGSLPLDKIETFATALRKRYPIRLTPISFKRVDTIFRCEDQIYVNGNAEFKSNCQAFYYGWVACHGN